MKGELFKGFELKEHLLECFLQNQFVEYDGRLLRITNWEIKFPDIHVFYFSDGQQIEIKESRT